MDNPQFSFMRFGVSLPVPFPPPSPSPVSSVSPHTRIPRVFLLVGLLVSPVSSASPRTRSPRVFPLVGLLVWTWVGVVFMWLTEGTLFMVLGWVCLDLGCASCGYPLWVMWLVMTGWVCLWQILAGCGYDWQRVGPAITRQPGVQQVSLVRNLGFLSQHGQCPFVFLTVLCPCGLHGRVNRHILRMGVG